MKDSQGNVISRRDFKPFGEAITSNTGERTTTAKYGAADNLRQKFTTYQRDEESGLDFAEARMYENRHGRFTAVDPLLASGKSANPQTFNRFVYVLNSPLTMSDPDGLQAGSYAGRVWISADGTTFSNCKCNREGFTRYTGGPREIATESNGVEYRYQIRRNGWTLLGGSDDVLKSKSVPAQSPRTDNRDIREMVGEVSQGLDDALGGIWKGVGNAPGDFVNGLTGVAWSMRHGSYSLPDVVSENPFSIPAPFSASNARESSYMTAASEGVRFGLGAAGGTFSVGVARNSLGLVSESNTAGRITSVSTLEVGPFAEGAIPSTGPRISPAQSRQIQMFDRCHTCGIPRENAPGGLLYGDHQPPTGLLPDIFPRRIFPQCARWSNSQGGVVTSSLQGRRPNPYEQDR